MDTSHACGEQQVIGGRIRAYRLDLSITQTELGHRLWRQHTHTWISRAEAGNIRFTAPLLMQIAEGLRISYSGLVQGTSFEVSHG